MQSPRAWRATVRALLVVLAVAWLVSCGGGGGGGGGESAAPAPAITGNWQLALTAEGQTTPAVAVPTTAVPSEQQASQITTENVAQVFGSQAFSGYTVAVHGRQVTVTGPGTSYQMTIDSIAASNYRACGACGLGSQVAYDVDMNYTETGTFDGQLVPAATASLKITFTYVRVS